MQELGNLVLVDVGHMGMALPPKTSSSTSSALAMMTAQSARYSATLSMTRLATRSSLDRSKADGGVVDQIQGPCGRAGPELLARAHGQLSLDIS